MIILAGVAAIGGAAFLGFRYASEVRGNTMLDEVLPEAATPAPDPVAEYMLNLDAEDYTTYTHPTLGFSFRYPKNFDLLTDTWGNEEVVDVHQPTLPLSIRVTTQPFDPDGELVAALASLPDDYEREPPEGADSTAVGWIDEDMPEEGHDTAQFWCVRGPYLYQIMLWAPSDVGADVLSAWMNAFVHTNLTFES